MKKSTKPLSKNLHLIRWVNKMAALCKPDAIHWIDGSQAEYNALCAQMVAGGTFIKLNQKKWPGCYLARSDASDVARVEDRTFICSLSKEAAGPTNNWVNPFEMRKTLKEKFSGCMNGCFLRRPLQRMKLVLQRCDSSLQTWKRHSTDSSPTFFSRTLRGWSMTSSA